MSAVAWITSRGVRVRAHGGRIGLKGLASLSPDRAAEVLNYARRHKETLLEELASRRSLQWPAPEPWEHPISGTPQGRYAALFTLAELAGASLTEGPGGLSAEVPPGVPEDLAQAVRDGLRMLQAYVRRRLQ